METEIFRHSSFVTTPRHRGNYLSEIDGNNCTVFAFAATCGISYNEAFHALKAAGRILRKGACMTECMKKLPKKYTDNFIDVSQGVTGISVGTFRKRYPEGRFLILIKQHALSIVDGVIHDHSLELRKLIKGVYQYDESAVPAEP